MADNDDDFITNEIPTKPTHDRPRSPSLADLESDIHYRHGILLRDVTDLTRRIEALERIALQPRFSMRPQVQNAGISVVTAGVITGIIQALQFILGGHH